MVVEGIEAIIPAHVIDLRSAKKNIGQQREQTHEARAHLVLIIVARITKRLKG